MSQLTAPAGGVSGSPSPVCQIPYLFSPPDVWKPHTPEVRYSHIEFGLMFSTLLCGCRIDTHPPSLLSKFHGTLSAADGPVADPRMPWSSIPFGMMSASPGSWISLQFKSSPHQLLTIALPGPIVANRDEKTTSSSGRMNSLAGSTTSGRSIDRLRFRSRTWRPPAGKSVE